MRGTRFEPVSELDPNNPAHLIELARLAELTKDHEAALGYLGHARDVAPQTAQIHYLIAMIAAEIDLPVEARRSLDRALALSLRIRTITTRWDTSSCRQGTQRRQLLTFKSLLAPIRQIQPVIMRWELRILHLAIM